MIPSDVKQGCINRYSLLKGMIDGTIEEGKVNTEFENNKGGKNHEIDET